jgi:hypothetical protein
VKDNPKTQLLISFFSLEMAGVDSGTRNPVEKTRRGVEATEVVEEAAMEKASMGKIRRG